MATHHLLGWRCVGYVEIDEYCQAVLAQRIADGLLDPAPIFGDIRGFIREGYAGVYRGMVDIITAGFPCQPWSVAGRQRGERDERDLWPDLLEAIRIIRPQYCLLENVPGLLSRRHRYFETILGGLAESGYDAFWKVISAAEVGAPHGRGRLWIATVENAAWRSAQSRTQGGTFKQSGQATSWWARDPADNPAESRLDRVVNGMAHWVDRTRAIENGQVPRVVEVAWEVLTQMVGVAVEETIKRGKPKE